MPNIFKVLLIGVVIALFCSCNHDQAEAVLDVRLKEALSIFSKNGEVSYFIMPESDDYDALPNQDIHNPITKAKVTLGQFLFFETGLAQNPKNESCYETYSCSSCHVPSKGFLPGRMQGIADGAEGFGDFGSDRFMVDNYEESDLDAQGNRPLTVMNVTYMTNTLWSGLFGANDLNEGSEELWEGLAEVNHTGYAGLEAQNIEGFELHRLEINDHVLDDYDYRRWFTLAFFDRKRSERYTPETASFAMGAYLRTILTNQAPFQYYLKGDQGAITESQKRGALRRATGLK